MKNSLQNINAILMQNNLTELQQASLTIQSEPLDQEGLHTRLQNLQGAYVGWLCLTDEILLIDKNAKFKALEGRSILSGELCAGNRSIHIRQVGPVWQFYTLERSEGTNYLVVSENYCTRNSKRQLSASGIVENLPIPSAMCYEIYWQKTDTSDDLQAVASRFAGFVQNTKKEE